MYCKNCGKTLPDDARFCDKCNTSVRREKGKMDLIEELKEERLARQKAHEIEDRLKKIKKVRRKRYKIIAIIVLSIIAIWAIIVGITQFAFLKDSPLRGQEPQLQTTDTPKNTPTPTENTIAKKYKKQIIDRMTVTYPKAFDEIEADACISAFSDGTATIKINVENAITTPVELLDEYYKGILNAEIAEGESKADGDGYTVTVNSGTKKHHKKALIRDGVVYSYEMIYPKDESEKYEAYTEYMDENFTVS